MATSLYSREAYLEVKQEFDGNPIISPSFLRQEIALADGKTTYRYNFLKENTEPEAQKLLSRTDTFVVTHLGMYLLSRTGTLDFAEILHTYPNDVVFATEAPDLEAVYNGHVDVKINNIEVFERFPTNLFRYVPETIENATNNFTMSGGFGVADGAVELPMRINMDGSQKNSFTIELPVVSGIDVTPASGSNQLVLMLFGFLVSGAAVGAQKKR